MNQRIKAVRKAENLTQEAFASKLNLSRNFIAQVEMGTKEPSERTITDICREFKVNESWLKTGDGEMYIPADRAEDIADIVNAALDTSPEEARKSLIDRLSKLSDGEICVLAQILNRMFPD